LNGEATNPKATVIDLNGEATNQKATVIDLNREVTNRRVEIPHRMSACYRSRGRRSNPAVAEDLGPPTHIRVGGCFGEILVELDVEHLAEAQRAKADTKSNSSVGVIKYFSL
jgi:hypothetical protein